MGRVVSITGRHPSLGRWCCNPPKGYPRLTGGRKKDRREYVHRAVWKALGKAGPLFGELPDSYHVHHQNFNKMCFCPGNLIAMPASLHPANFLICPYTRRFVGPDEYKRVMGIGEGKEEEVPF